MPSIISYRNLLIPVGLQLLRSLCSEHSKEYYQFDSFATTEQSTKLHKSRSDYACVELVLKSGIWMRCARDSKIGLPAPRPQTSRSRITESLSYTIKQSRLSTVGTSR